MDFPPILFVHFPLRIFTVRQLVPTSSLKVNFDSVNSRMNFHDNPRFPLALVFFTCQGLTFNLYSYSADYLRVFVIILLDLNFNYNC